MCPLARSVHHPARHLQRGTYHAYVSQAGGPSSPGTIERWRTVAQGTLRALEDWREAPDVYFEHPLARTFEQAFEHDGEREVIVQSFMTCTTELNRAAIDLPLDPRPLQAVFDVVSVWNRTLSADQIPDQRRIRATFDSAFMVVDTIEARIRRRVKVRPEPAPQPVAPVAMNGRTQEQRRHPIVPMPKAEASQRQQRLSVKLDPTRPYIIFDGTPLPAPEDRSITSPPSSRRTVTRCPSTGGSRVIPSLKAQVSTRVVNGIPEPVRAFIDSPGKGRPPASRSRNWTRAIGIAHFVYIRLHGIPDTGPRTNSNRVRGLPTVSTASLSEYGRRLAAAARGPASLPPRCIV